MTTAWYGKSSTKQLQSLLQSKPKLFQLLNQNQFLQQLKSYNTKLLDYVTNNPSLIGQALQIIISPPLNNDSNDRKYKYPLQIIQMIQTQTTCILNSFFKQVPNSTGTQYFDTLWNIVQEVQILPILAGYFFRTNICLLNNRYKETLDRIYLKPFFLTQILNHCSHMPMANTIQLYLNLDINKSSQSDPARLQIKKDVIKKILSKIDTQRKLKRPDSALIIQNLMTVLIQTIQKYYLILDGKILVELLTSQQSIQTMLSLIKQNWEGSFPAFNFFISLINYYSFSSFNSDDNDPEKKAKNLQRLQAQPMVIGLKLYFPNALDKITKASTITLYQYKLLEILCHCISISSEQLLKIIKDSKFFACLINLMFKHQQNNILHMLIEKSFLHVFISERKIYDQYKRHLFCQVDIIDLTASRVLNQYSEDKIFEQFKKKIFFGHFMRILKIYSGIQTTEQTIINSIKSKTDIWNKISTFLIKPYEAICFKQLGTYQNISEGKNQQFMVTRPKQQANTPMINPKPLTTSMIEQIRKEDHALPLKKQDQISNILPPPIKQQMYLQKQKQQQLLKAPTHNLPLQLQKQPAKQIKKSQSFKQFMTKKKQQAEKQIKLKRSLSHQKRLSGSKGKITGSSPKKNNWTEKEESNSQTDRSVDANSNSTKLSSSSIISKNKSATQGPRILPYVPRSNMSLNMSSANNQNNVNSSNLNTIGNNFQQQAQNTSTTPYRSYYGSSIQNKSSPGNQKQKQKIQQSTSPSWLQNKNKSDKNLQIIKKIKVIQIQAPKQKKYRRIQEKDKILLDFLGITSGPK